MLARMLKDERGAKAIEYGLNLGLIGIAATIAVASVILV